MMPTRLSRSLVLQLPLHHLKECLNRSEVSPNVDFPDLSARDRRNTEIYGGPLANAIEGAAYQSRMGIIAPVRLCFWFFCICNHRFLEKFSFSGVK